MTKPQLTKITEDNGGQWLYKHKLPEFIYRYKDSNSKIHPIALSGLNMECLHHPQSNKLLSFTQLARRNFECHDFVNTELRRFGEIIEQTKYKSLGAIWLNDTTKHPLNTGLYQVLATAIVAVTEYFSISSENANRMLIYLPELIANPIMWDDFLKIKNGNFKNWITSYEHNSKNDNLKLKNRQIKQEYILLQLLDLNADQKNNPFGHLIKNYAPLANYPNKNINKKNQLFQQSKKNIMELLYGVLSKDSANIMISSNFAQKLIEKMEEDFANPYKMLKFLQNNMYLEINDKSFELMQELIKQEDLNGIDLLMVSSVVFLYQLNKNNHFVAKDFISDFLIDPDKFIEKYLNSMNNIADNYKLLEINSLDSTILKLAQPAYWYKDNKIKVYQGIKISSLLFSKSIDGDMVVD